MSNPALKQALSKIRWRILPFVALMFAMAIIDPVSYTHLTLPTKA